MQRNFDAIVLRQHHRPVIPDQTKTSQEDTSLHTPPTARRHLLGVPLRPPKKRRADGGEKKAKTTADTIAHAGSAAQSLRCSRQFMLGADVTTTTAIRYYIPARVGSLLATLLGNAETLMSAVQDRQGAGKQPLAKSSDLRFVSIGMNTGLGLHWVMLSLIDRRIT